MQSQKFRNDRNVHEATPTKSRIKIIKVHQFNKSSTIDNERCSRRFCEGLVSTDKENLESIMEVNDDDHLPSFCGPHMEHSYHRDDSSPPSTFENTNNVEAPLVIKRIMPIQTYQQPLDSKKVVPKSFNVNISPTSPPPLVPIKKLTNLKKVFVMNKDIAILRSAVKDGKAYITNSAKTAAAEVVAADNIELSTHLDSLSYLVCSKSENGLNVLKKGNTETVKSNCQKQFSKKNFKPSYVTVPYLILGDGKLVKLDDVEDLVPFDLIPVPPMVLFHTSKSGVKPPSVILTRSAEETAPTLSSALPDSHPDLETPTGLLVQPYPDGCSLPIFDHDPDSKLSVDERSICVPNEKISLVMNLGAPVDTSVGDTKFVVMRSKDSRNTKKKTVIDVKVIPAEKLRKRVPHCPEIVNFLEIVPHTPPQARCRVCDILYQSIRQCEYHIRSKHLSQTCVFACDICSKKFATNFLKRRHMRIAHDRSRNFICSSCGATFRSNGSLKRHEIRHGLSEQPFLCEYCGKGFYGKANYMKHKILVHLEKKIFCTVCGDTFLTNVQLNEHLVIHNGGWLCKVCGEKFQRRNGLRIHMLSHGKSNLAMRRNAVNL